MLNYTCQVCPIFIPTGHTTETSLDDNLHNAFIFCPMLRDGDNATIQQLFRDCLQEIYDKLIDIDADPIEVPEDYYSAFATAPKTTRDNQNVELEPQLLLYLTEFYKIVRIGGINNPFACVEWPGI